MNRYGIDSKNDRISSGNNAYFSHSLQQKNRQRINSIDFDRVKLKSRETKINKVFSDWIRMVDVPKIY